MAALKTSEIPAAPIPREDLLAQLRQQLLRLISLVSIIVMSLTLLLSIVLPSGLPFASPLPIVVLIIAILLNSIWLYLSLRGQYTIPAFGLSITLAAIAIIAQQPVVNASLLVVFTISILLPTPAFLVILAAIGAKLTFESITHVQANLPLTSNNAADIYIFISLRLLLLLAGLGIHYLVRRAESIVTQSERNSILLRAASEVGQASTGLSDLNSLFNRVITLVQERFGYYHVQVFIVNSTGDQAVLQASTGEIGKRLLARRHQLAVGSQSLIGQVTMRAEPVIAKDTDRDEMHFRNELLVNTRSEVAVPIRDGAVVVGALDVQSDKANAFDATDIQALQLVADFLGAAIRNSQQYEEQAKIARQNRELLAESENKAREIERLNAELTRSSWENYARIEGKTRGVTLQGNQLVETTEWTDALKVAGAEGRPVLQRSGERGVIAVPLKLRGEVIGAIEVEADAGAANEDAVDMVEAVAQRLAISLENARLYEESREATAQEQFINTLSARYQSITTVDELLRLTLIELGQTLGAYSGAIRLGGALFDDTDGLGDTGNGGVSTNHGALAR